MTNNKNPIPPVTRDDPTAHSGDVVGDNIAALKALFPAIVTDGKVDFDVLRQLLGDEVEEGAERYGLNWKGKARARAFALTPSLGTLRPAKADSKDWDTTRNIMIEGDNLEVLKLLRKSYAGKVKLIYIDPPYNTGKDFVYPDNFTDSLANYEALTGQRGNDGARLASNRESSGRLHTDWLAMIYPRLLLAMELLSPDGLIAISIDENEHSNLYQVCASAFGEENVVGTIVWKNATDNNPTNIAVEHEYIVVIAKNKNNIPKEWKSVISPVKDILVKIGEELTQEFEGIPLEEAYSEWFKEHRSQLWPLDRYRYIDSGGVYTGSQSVHNPGKEGYRYDVLHPTTGKPCKQPLMGYRFPSDTMNELIKAGRILFGEDHNKIIELKVYARDYREKLPSWIDIDGRLGAYDLRDDFPEAARAFSNPKPVRLIKTLSSFVTNNERDIVMDFFAGSGTTGRAVMEQSAEEGSRRYILVQLPEPLDPKKAEQKAAADFCDALGKPRNIAELTKERLRRAGAKVQADYPEAKLDTGFRVYKLATSNLKPWQPGDDLALDLLANASNLIDGRSEDDLLVELLLKTGIDLTVPGEARQIAGNTVHLFGAGTLVVCLSDILAAEARALGDGIADWIAEVAPPAPTTFFFKDSGFDPKGQHSAEARANLAATLRQRLGDDAIEKLGAI